MSGRDDLQILRNLEAVAQLRHRRKTLALQRETSAWLAHEASLAARREKVRTMADDVATFRRDYTERMLAQDPSASWLSSSIDALLEQRGLEMRRSLEEQARAAEARGRVRRAAAQLMVEDERLKRHRDALRDLLAAEAERQDEWYAE